MVTKTKFSKSKVAWDACEDCFIRYLNSLPDTEVIEQAHGKHPDWDVKAMIKWKEVTFEVKSDRKSEHSHNFCIEFYNIKSETPSWICTSKADYYVYYSDMKWRMTKRPDLIHKLIIWKFDDIRDGWNNNSRMIILPKEQLPDYFTEITGLTEVPRKKTEAKECVGG